jgi:deoxyribodipyrimidine photo-lyase
MSAIVWLRRDLRLSDHAALHAAYQTGLAVCVLYIHAPKEDGEFQRGAASNTWLHQSLLALDKSLQAIGSKLTIRSGDSKRELLKICDELQATHVFWHRLYEKHAVDRDTEIKATLKAKGIHAESFAGHMLNEPWAIKTGAGDTYRVFTPYWRNAATQFQPKLPRAIPKKLPQAKTKNGLVPDSLPVDALKLMPKRNWHEGFWHLSKPGEQGAHEAVELFSEGALSHYIEGRDRPDQVGTSRMGAHLHFGEISVNELAYKISLVKRKGVAEHQSFYLRELGWRDFGHQLMYYFPHTATKPLNKKFEVFPWADEKAHGGELLRAWQKGQTGIPIVDAGMRELWQTGYMHNRVRMIVASFLTKNLRFHWIHGARWFWDTLLDADLANNSAGWQWSGGSGADAAPYFRIFNPVSQGEKFDAAGGYVKRYVPELASLGPKHIHQPWSMGGVKGYPAPIVDLKASREAALKAFATLKMEVASG